MLSCQRAENLCELREFQRAVRLFCGRTLRDGKVFAGFVCGRDSHAQFATSQHTQLDSRLHLSPPFSPNLLTSNGSKPSLL